MKSQVPLFLMKSHLPFRKYELVISQVFAVREQRTLEAIDELINGIHNVYTMMYTYCMYDVYTKGDL